MTVTAAAIKQQARTLGFDKTGIVAATALTEEGARLNEWLARGFHGQMNYLARDPQQRSDPRLLLPSAKSVVCVALNYFQPEKHSDADEEGGHIRLLPDSELLVEDDRDLGFEVHR